MGLFLSEPYVLQSVMYEYSIGTVCFTKRYACWRQNTLVRGQNMGWPQLNYLSNAKDIYS